MKKSDSANSASNRWLLCGTIFAIASLAIIMLAPNLVGAVMGYGGDGVGQFFAFLMIGGVGFVFLCISAVFLLLLSLLAWIS